MPRSTTLRIVPVKINGLPFWQVIAPKPEGKGWTRRTFKQKLEAKAHFEHLKIELLNRGTKGLAFTDAFRADAVTAREILFPFGITLTDAARAYALAHEREARSETVAVAVAQLLAAKERDGSRPRYVRDLRTRLGGFARAFANRTLASFTAGEIHDWLAGLGVAPVTENTVSLRLSVLWTFAVNRGWAPENIISRIPKLKVAEGVSPIGILAPEELVKVLEAASGDTLAYWLLGAFAGLRSAELERLEWVDVHFEAGLVEVPALKSKTASRRFVDIQPNLAAWLAPFQGRTGKIAPPDLYRRLVADRSRANLTHWAPNALRHSFASYYLAKFQNAAALALQLGHVNQQLIFRNYRELVRPAAAQAYWNIFPAKETAITPFSSVA